MDAIVFNNLKIKKETFLFRASGAVPIGQITMLLGASGSGKSTFLNVLAGLECPDEGQLKIAGLSVLKKSPRDRSVAMVMQKNNLFPHLTVMQNVGLALKPTLRLHEEDRRYILSILEQLELDKHINQRGDQLSGGEEQRVALARALVAGAKILLLDEPCQGIGPAQKQEIMMLIQHLQQQYQWTVIMSTHLPEEVLPHATHGVFMEEGQVVYSGALIDMMELPMVKRYRGI